VDLSGSEAGVGHYLENLWSGEVDLSESEAGVDHYLENLWSGEVDLSGSYVALVVEKLSKMTAVVLGDL